ncbi:unnamed protein product, partial [Sphagnum jensenii]
KSGYIPKMKYKIFKNLIYIYIYIGYTLKTKYINMMIFISSFSHLWQLKTSKVTSFLNIVDDGKYIYNFNFYFYF